LGDPRGSRRKEYSPEKTRNSRHRHMCFFDGKVATRKKKLRENDEVNESGRVQPVFLSRLLSYL
jgi:hypothetical protein